MINTNYNFRGGKQGKKVVLSAKFTNIEPQYKARI